jgi:hypothetical protein
MRIGKNVEGMLENICAQVDCPDRGYLVSFPPLGTILCARHLTCPSPAPPRMLTRKVKRTNGYTPVGRSASGVNAKHAAAPKEL